jgi:hypothetical protein
MDPRHHIDDLRRGSLASLVRLVEDRARRFAFRLGAKSGKRAKGIIMRLIKFRYWDPEMVIPGILQTPPTSVSTKGAMLPANRQTLPMLPPDVELMSWSGLCDKNGIDIYEADLIELDEEFARNTGAERTLCMVGFQDGMFMYGRNEEYPHDLNTVLWIACRLKACTVVGNVFQTPNWMLPAPAATI